MPSARVTASSKETARALSARVVSNTAISLMPSAVRLRRDVMSLFTASLLQFRVSHTPQTACDDVTATTGRRPTASRMDAWNIVVSRQVPISEDMISSGILILCPGSPHDAGWLE